MENAAIVAEGLCLGGPTTRPAAESAAWIAVLLAVTVPAAIARYRHAAST